MCTMVWLVEKAERSVRTMIVGGRRVANTSMIRDRALVTGSDSEVCTTAETTGPHKR